jgi:hypothetical protein
MAITRAAVLCGITVDHFLPEAPMWHSYPLILMQYRHEVAYNKENGIHRFPLADKAENTGCRIVVIHPDKTSRVPIAFVQCGLAAVQVIRL